MSPRSRTRVSRYRPSPSPSPSSPDPTLIEWHLTPSNAGLLRGLLYASWTLSGGIAFSIGLLVLVSGVSAVGSAVSVPIPDSVSVPIPVSTFGVAVGIIATVFGLGWLVLERLRSSRYGLTFCRLRLPEPSDPRRSVVEHASPATLSALATVGAIGYGSLFAITVSFEHHLASGLGFGLVLVTYVALVGIRWWLPTAGTLDTRRRTLSVVSFPRDDAPRVDDRPGRTWHGALETAVEYSVDDLERVRRVTFGTTSILVCSGSVRVPIVAAIPSSVAETIVDDFSNCP
ncbi:hypothetical protein [Halomontanus rarus]|uniref:hypothetical protein n=1 Tax=Halomontanus rarus TaxID=3034020 RepID=UPI001A9A09CF